MCAGYHPGRSAALRIVFTALALVIALAETSRAQIAEERLPAANLPASAPSAAAATPQTSSTPSGEDASTDWQRLPDDVANPAISEPAPAPLEPPATQPGASAAAAVETPEAAATAASAEPPEATPLAIAPPPALDLDAANIGPDLGAASLEPEIKHAATPARAASLRLTEKARQELLKGGANGALQDLGRAVSIDPGNPFEYYYLGRVYLTRHNYAQAMTFFHRAELGFAGRPDWLGETLSFEGACNEQLGRTPDAASAYRRAVALSPGNFRAQAGFGRLGASTSPTSNSPVTGLDLPAPSEQSAAAPPAAPAPPPAPDEPPAPPSAQN